MRISDWSSDVCSSDLFRIIPGISADAGIPVTHRDTNSAVTFITGHGVGGAVPDGIDWAALAKGSPVIVLYMALKHLAIIAATLQQHGRAAAEPVAVVSQATLPAQVVLESTLGRCADDTAAAGIYRKSTRLNSSHQCAYRIPSSARKTKTIQL